MSEVFTTDEIQTLSAQIDAQLAELQQEPESSTRAGITEKVLRAQLQALEKATGEKADNFLEKFKRAARKDLCEEGGVLYAQWQRWKDLTNDKVLKSFGAILVAMGLAGNALQVAVVALAVIVLHIGVKAICEE